MDRGRAFTANFLRQFGDMTVEQLQQYADTPAELLDDSNVGNASDPQVDAKLEKAAQANDLRKRLFVTVQRALTGALAAAVAIMGLYICSQWGEVDAAVIISFNAAVVVNTIGLAYIVANYLFPKGGGD